MNRSLRQQHLRVMRALRVALPVVVLLAIAGYRLPVRSSLPESLLHRLPEGAERQFQEEGVYEGVRLRVEVWKVPPETPLAAPANWVRFEALEPLRQPDVMIYWSSRSSDYAQPPLGASMLGVWDPRAPEAYKLPPQAAYLRGYLVLYSLGQKVLITQMRLPAATP